MLSKLFAQISVQSKTKAKAFSLCVITGFMLILAVLNKSTLCFSLKSSY